MSQQQQKCEMDLLVSEGFAIKSTYIHILGHACMGIQEGLGIVGQLKN